MTIKQKRGAGQSLSTASPYENLFHTRHRGRGRPDGTVEPLFVGPEGVDPLLINTARRRAYAVIHEEQRERMAEIFQAELKVLRRRGVIQVAHDVGADLRKMGYGGEPGDDVVQSER